MFNYKGNLSHEKKKTPTFHHEILVGYKNGDPYVMVYEIIPFFLTGYRVHPQQIHLSPNHLRAAHLLGPPGRVHDPWATQNHRRSAADGSGAGRSGPGGEIFENGDVRKAMFNAAGNLKKKSLYIGKHFFVVSIDLSNFCICF